MVALATSQLSTINRKKSSNIFFKNASIQLTESEQQFLVIRCNKYQENPVFRIEIEIYMHLF